MAFPETWEQFFRFSLQPIDGTVVEFTGETEDITDIEFFKKDFDGKQMANGGMIKTHKNYEPEMTKLKVYPLGKTSDLEALQAGDTTATYPLSISNTHTHNLHQAVILWCSGLPSSPATAGAVTVEGDAALRYTMKAVEIVDIKHSWEDKQLVAEVTLKWNPFNKDGTSNKTKDSTDGGAGDTLAAVTSYASS